MGNTFDIHRNIDLKDNDTNLFSTDDNIKN